MLSFKNWLNNYFGVTKREYNGLLALILLIVLTSVSPYLYTSFFVKDETLSIADQVAIQQLRLINNEEHPIATKFAAKSRLFKFDPNLITVDQWRQLGLSSKQAQAIINYLNKGGKFRQVADLKKMYTISPKMFERLQSFIQIATRESEIKPVIATKTEAKKESIIVEINRADTLSLDKIKGIGPAFARRIVKYRERLGGFYQKKQLMEVYGLDSLKYEEIETQLWIDASAIRKININTADFETLKNHPYLKYKQINAIIQYRKQHGNYKDAADLKKVLILTPETIELIAPYLIF
ncbi:MAG: helix-hairpin-helix domain-containing protein [Bacteroidota bacterium]